MTLKRSPMARTGILRSASVNQAKQIKCKVCKAQPVARPGAVVCGIECAVQWQNRVIAKTARAKAKAVRVIDAARKQELKSIPELKAEAQTAFNAFIRARDADQPCICCGQWNKSEALSGGAWDAGHYRSRGSADHLRYNENNVHKQLKNCNRYASGNAVAYRLGLIQRIGLAAVEALEADQALVKWTREMLLEIRASYRVKLKELKVTG